MIKKSTKRIILCAFWLCCFVASVAFVYIYGPTLIDSDQSADLILANNLGFKKIFDGNWYYSTCIKVFDIHQFMKIGMLFTDNWMTARAIGQALVLALLSCSCIFAGKKLIGTDLSILVAGAMMCPFSFWYQFQGIMFGFYIPYMVLVLIYLGTAVRLYQWLSDSKFNLSEKFRKTAILAAGGVISALIGGLEGMRMLMNFFAPFMAALIILYIVKLHNGEKPDFAFPCMFGGILFSNFLGIVINVAILSKLYTFSNKADSWWINLSFPEIINDIGKFFECFGYPTVRGMLPYPLFSVQGMLSAFSLLLMAIFVFSVIMLFKRFNKLTDIQKLVLLTGIMMATVTCLCISLLDQDGYGSYYLPCMPVMMIIIGMEIKTGEFRYDLSRTALAATVALCVVATSIVHSSAAVKRPYAARPELRPLAQQLAEEGYNKGVALFWESDVMTAMTNGELEMWTVESLLTMEPTKWLQSKDHDILPDDYFVVVNLTDENSEEYIQNSDKEPIMENWPFVIYY